jgi:hypothetical protein
LLAAISFEGSHHQLLLCRVFMSPSIPAHAGRVNSCDRNLFGQPGVKRDGIKALTSTARTTGAERPKTRST